jgi:hypothetical protein
VKALVVCSLVAVVFAGCGGSDGGPDALAGCDVELAGNFAESASSMTSCPTLVPGAGATQGDMILLFTVASQELGGNFGIDLDLGRMPTPGVYRSDTTELWTASGVKEVAGGGACLFLAGNNATPAGYFTLDLAAVDDGTPHGDLSLTMFVLPRTADDGSQADCGPGTTEELQVRF